MSTCRLEGHHNDYGRNQIVKNAFYDGHIKLKYAKYRSFVLCCNRFLGFCSLAIWIQ